MKFRYVNAMVMGNGRHWIYQVIENYFTSWGSLHKLNSCHSHVVAQVYARGVTLLQVNHFLAHSYLGLAKPFWVAGFSAHSLSLVLDHILA